MVAAGVLVPIIVLSLLAAIAIAVIVVIYCKGLHERDVSIEQFGSLAIRILQEIKE